MSKNTLFLMVFCLAGLSGCGDKRTSAHLRSPDEIKAVTDTFTAGSTHIQNVYDALGLWNASGVDGLDEHVIYWTNDGGQTQVNFKFTCDAGTTAYPDCLDVGGVQRAHLLYSGSVH